MIGHATRLATAYAVHVEPRMHVEVDDLAGAALLAKAQGRRLENGIVDELRKIGGRSSRVSHRQLIHSRSDKLQGQIGEGFDMAGPEPQYVVRLALKRCGVLMLDCLPERERRVMLLRYWHDLTQAEAAAELGVTPGRVGQIERAACKVIAAELARRGIRSMRDVV